MSDKGEEEGFKNLKKWVISFLDAPAVQCALFSIFPIIFRALIHLQQCAQIVK